MKRVAAIQMASGPNVSANLTEAERLISRAAAAGAELMVLPENFPMMGMNEQDKVGIREADGQGSIQQFLAETALRHQVWIVAGTVPLMAGDAQHVRAACLVYNERGEQVARYDKIHLFDVVLEETGETYTESATIEPGDSIKVIDSPFGRMGLAVCYDLRFPEMFRRMVDDGVELIVLPAAFTALTGKAHWEALLRARAIENLCYVVAAAQGGFHVNGRETHGDSMIVDPWGVVLDRLPRGSGFVIAELDLDKVASTRRSFPALDHRRIPCYLPK
ncbi:MAG: carbon-nitrogen hydrolase family protein [Pseudomonadota bacterium]|nr:MAG: carbon-nitrogen hydrolase family protein [Pseudomonadota bacterium]